MMAATFSNSEMALKVVPPADWSSMEVISLNQFFQSFFFHKAKIFYYSSISLVRCPEMAYMSAHSS